MANQLDRRALVRWLLAHKFNEAVAKAGGHRKFVHAPTGVAVTVAAHGPQDITKKHVGMIIRQLVAAGFDRDALRRDLLGLPPAAVEQDSEPPDSGR